MDTHAHWFLKTQCRFCSLFIRTQCLYAILLLVISSSELWRLTTQSDNLSSEEAGELDHVNHDHPEDALCCGAHQNIQKQIDDFIWRKPSLLALLFDLILFPSIIPLLFFPPSLWDVKKQSVGAFLSAASELIEVNLWFAALASGAGRGYQQTGLTLPSSSSGFPPVSSNASSRLPARTLKRALGVWFVCFFFFFVAPNARYLLSFFPWDFANHGLLFTLAPVEGARGGSHAVVVHLKKQRSHLWVWLLAVVLHRFIDWAEMETDLTPGNSPLCLSPDISFIITCTDSANGGKMLSAHSDAGSLWRGVFFFLNQQRLCLSSRLFSGIIMRARGQEITHNQHKMSSELEK